MHNLEVEVERCFTIPKAARKLGIPTWTLRRAVKAGEVPCFSFGTNRKLVRLSDIEAAIDRAKGGEYNAFNRRF